MNAEALAVELVQSPTHAAWIDVLARLFERHRLHFGHGTDNARDEAYWLLRHVEGWDDAAWERGVNVKSAPAVARLALRRVEERKPLAYLINEAWFAGLKFFVDERVLVPRSPLAELIEGRFAPWRELSPGDAVLDVGTGSGCIAIAAAHYCEGVRVHATDISADALAVAEKNIAAHGCAERVHLYEADLLPSVPDRYRVIISNPPYVAAGTMEGLPEEYRAEPAIGLAGGRSGLEPALRLLRAASGRLADDGLLVVEVGEGAERLRAALPRLPATWLELERGGEGVFVVDAGELAVFVQANEPALSRVIAGLESGSGPGG